MQAYRELCYLAKKQNDPVEYMAWTMFGLEPKWYKELIK